MRICIVTQYFWPENFRINDLVQGLVDKGHAIQVLTGLPNYPSGRVASGYFSLLPKRSTALACSVLRVPLIPRGKGSGLRLAANYLSFASSATMLGVPRIREPIDVVLAYEPSPVTVAVPALALGRRLGVPVLMWVQDLWPETLRAMRVVGDGWALRAATKYTRSLHRAMDGLLVQSRAFIQALESQGVASSKIVYLPNWAEDYFKPTLVPANAPESQELPPGFIVLFAGNLGKAQGLEVLLGAAERTRRQSDIHWVVLGDGRQAQWIRDEVRRRRLDNVHLLGRKSQESMPTWFALADSLLVTLRPDPVYELTIPSKVQQYMACGRPILASLDGEGAHEVERSGAGLASPAGDAEALAAGAEKLYRLSEEDRLAMGERGRNYYERNYDRATLIGRVEAVLEQAISSRSGARATA